MSGEENSTRLDLDAIRARLPGAAQFLAEQLVSVEQPVTEPRPGVDPDAADYWEQITETRGE